MKNYRDLYDGIGDWHKASYFDYLNKLTERPKPPKRRVRKYSSTPLKNIEVFHEEDEKPHPEKWHRK